ncbi:hypothetical protein KFU94_65980 [Chloroflexi bacterium TSY]|nr:hypothetical protein [Chloroflexi bacterium TSY]
MQHRDRLGTDLILWGDDVVRIQQQRVREEHVENVQLTAQRVSIPQEVGAQLTAKRQSRSEPGDYLRNCRHSATDHIL